MSDVDFDDFGGFEAAEPEPFPAASPTVNAPDSDDSAPQSAVGQTPAGISAIPWLAASLQSNLPTAVASIDKCPAEATLASGVKSKYEALSLNSTEEPSLSWSASSETPSQPANSNAESTLSSGGNVPPVIPSQPQSSTAVSSISETSQDLIANVQQELTKALDEKHKFRSEAISLKLQNESSIKQLEEITRQLEQQRDSYRSLQVTHERELEALKKSNNDAVAMIIQEYKEHNKTAMLEVQRACSELLTSQMKMEGEKFEQMFKEQASRYDLWKEETERSTQKWLTESLEAVKSDMQKEIELDRENLRLKAEADVKVARDGFDSLKADLFTEMSNQNQQNLAQLETQSKVVIEELAAELKSLVSIKAAQVAESERSASLEYWEKSSQDMLVKFQKSVQEVLDNQRSSVDNYIQEKVKADQSAQRTQLSAIDVYLEAARQHLKSLTDQPDS